MKLQFSIIIPVYNRPQEIDELLDSLSKQDFNDNFEVIVVEDGSTNTAEDIVKKYKDGLDIHYFFKENTGAGDSRNFGMKHASGNYFIILDSDVILPENYLTAVNTTLNKKYTDAFGGPDAAHKSFTTLQKAINYSMTSLLTTGGIRGKKIRVGKYQLRSYNLGMSKEAFESIQGFSRMKIAEDIDLTFRLWEKGFTSQLIEKAYVYHKRRASIKQFFRQTYAFGKARPMLNKMYPQSKKLTFWFPSLFIIGFDLSLLLLLFGSVELFSVYYLYFIAILIHSSFENNFRVGFLSIITTFTQMLGYGLGFLESMFFRGVR